MAFSKPNFYFSMAFVILMVVTMILVVGNHLKANRSATLSSVSVSYIGNYTDYYSDAKLDDMTSQDIAKIKNDSWISGEDEKKLIDIGGTLSPINYFREKFNKITGTILFIYNIPTFLLRSFGIPINELGHHLINITVLILYGFIGYMIIKVLRGG